MYYQHDVSLVSDVNLDHLASGSVCGVSLLESYSFFPLPSILYFFEGGVPMQSPDLRT